MTTTTVRIKRETKQALDQIANQTGQKTQEILDYAIDAYRKRVFLAQANRAYAKLRQDNNKWAEEVAERKGSAGLLRRSRGKQGPAPLRWITRHTTY